MGAAGEQALGTWTVPHQWRQQHRLAANPLDELTTDQKAKLQELARSLQADGTWSREYHDFYTLRRFLKARDWDVAKAKQMWQDMLAFRANNQVDTILHDFVFHEREAVLAAYPHGLHKVDREGRPVLVYKFGCVDLDALEKITSNQRITQFHIQEYERIMKCVLPACSLLAGRHIEKICTIIDVGGVRMRDIGRVMDLLSMYIKVDGNNYPETLASMVIINAPMWFSGSFALVKRMLSAETQKKVQILGSGYQATLHGLIHPENLLPEFGGTSSGRLADGLGPWTAVLERLRSAELAAARAHDVVTLPSKVSGGVPDQASPVADVRQRDDDSHVTSHAQRRLVSGSGSHVTPQAQHVEHVASQVVHVEHVLHPPEPVAHGDSQQQHQHHIPVVQGTAHQGTGIQGPARHAGQKHEWQDTQGQGEQQHGGAAHSAPQQHNGRDVRMRSGGGVAHAGGEAMQGVELHDPHHHHHHQPHGPGQNGVPAGPASRPTLHQTSMQRPGQPPPPHLAPITEAALMSHSSHQRQLDVFPSVSDAASAGPGESGGVLSPLLSPLQHRHMSQEYGHHAALDSFYSIPDSVTWAGENGIMLQGAASLAASQQRLQHQQQVQRSGSSLGQQPAGAAAAAAGDLAASQQAPLLAADHQPQLLTTSLRGPSGSIPLTEAGLVSHHSLDSNQGALYKSLDATLDRSLDAVSVVSFESCRSEGSLTGSSTHWGGPQQNGVSGGSPPSGGAAGRPGKVSRSSSRRAGDSGRAAGGSSRLPRWLGGRGSGEYDLLQSPPQQQQQHAQTHAQTGSRLSPGRQRGDHEWSDVDSPAGPPHMPPAAGPYGVLPSFTAWGPAGPIMYTADPAAMGMAAGAGGPAMFLPAGFPLQPLGGAPGAPIPIGMIPPGYLAALQPPMLGPNGVPLPAALQPPAAAAAQHSRAALQLNEYMRMWLQSASDVFQTARGPPPSSSRQQLLDPNEASFFGDAASTMGGGGTPGPVRTEPARGVGAGDGAAEGGTGGVPAGADGSVAGANGSVAGGAAGAAGGNVRARTRAEMIMGAAHHKRTRSGSHANLRVQGMSDDMFVSTPSTQAMSQGGMELAVGRPPAASVAVGGGSTAKLPAVNYEVYVDSEDEDGAGLLHRRDKQVLLPRYGKGRMFLRSICCFTCCVP